MCTYLLSVCMVDSRIDCITYEFMIFDAVKIGILCPVRAVGTGQYVHLCPSNSDSPRCSSVRVLRLCQRLHISFSLSLDSVLVFFGCSRRKRVCLLDTRHSWRPGATGWQQRQPSSCRQTTSPDQQRQELGSQNIWIFPLALERHRWLKGLLFCSPPPPWNLDIPARDDEYTASATFESRLENLDKDTYV